MIVFYHSAVFKRKDTKKKNADTFCAGISYIKETIRKLIDTN